MRLPPFADNSATASIAFEAVLYRGTDYFRNVILLSVPERNLAIFW